jgi:nitrite reductase/ring-hydroxylating ferredoxin subunit
VAELEPPLRIPRPAELDASGLATVTVEDRDIVILLQDGVLRAVDRWCPHEEGDMGMGMMFRGNIKCPLHGYIFNLTTGRCLNAFGLFARVYQVDEDDGDLVLTALSKPAGRGL